MLFPLGRITITPIAFRALQRAEQSPHAFLTRHVSGDWGDLDAEDTAVNARALQEGTRLLSVYHTDAGARLYVMTEWDRSETTILLPEEY